MVMILYCITCYFLGSFPSAFLAGRIKGIDIRNYGSGNIGASNTFRTLGKLWGAAVLIIDILKGAAAILLAVFILEGREEGEVSKIVGAAAVILGHVYPVWLKFKGGKGVATGLGALLGLAWVSVLGALAVFIVVLLIFRFMSLASISAAATLPILFFLQHDLPDNIDIFIFINIISVVVIYKHSGNIKRLINKEEPKLSFGSIQKTTGNKNDF